MSKLTDDKVEASQRTSCCRKGDSSRWPAPYFCMRFILAQQKHLSAQTAHNRVRKTTACGCTFAQGSEGLAACLSSGACERSVGMLSSTNLARRMLRSSLWQAAHIMQAAFSTIRFVPSQSSAYTSLSAILTHLSLNMSKQFLWCAINRRRDWGLWLLASMCSRRPGHSAKITLQTSS